jgi:hypothetical protein
MSFDDVRDVFIRPLKRKRRFQATSCSAGWDAKRPGHEVVDLRVGMTIDDLRQRVGDVGLRIDAVELACFDERRDRRPVLAATIPTREESVLAVERHGPDGSLDDVGVNLDAAVVNELREALPT